MTADHAHALPAGTVLEGYRIERLLGEGGFGLTYYAVEEAIDRPVALKEYLPLGIGARDHQSLAVMPVSEDRGREFGWGLERFRKEAATLVQFEHPNIVGIHRFFEALGTAYLVMQYIEGVSLEEILRRTGHVPEAELRVIIDPLLDGLEEIHKAGYLHRDIKPANIVLREDGRPVLIDFGAARQFRQSNTVPLTSILTEGFAPLEQYQPDSEQGPWTDIYAIGAVLYMCVTGERPVSATSRAEASALDKVDPLEPASSACVGQYSQAFLDGIDAALSLSRERRPQTVGELRAMLSGSAGTAPAAETSAPIGPDGKPLPAPATPLAAEARTLRAQDSGAEPAADTLALKPRRRAGRNRAPKIAALSLLILAGVAGISYGAWRYGDRLLPAPENRTAADPATAGKDTAKRDADTADARMAAARRSLSAAKTALDAGDFRGAGQATADALRHARAALAARPTDQEARVLIAEIGGFEQALGRARKQHVAALLDNAAKAIDRRQWDEARSLIANAESAGAMAAEVARMRARLEEARASGGRLKTPPDAPKPATPELETANREIGVGWQALRKNDFATAVARSRSAGREIAAARAKQAPERHLRATVDKAGELRQAISVALNKRITALRQAAQSAIQSGDVDGGKRRLEAADRLRKMLVALKGA